MIGVQLCYPDQATDPQAAEKLWAKIVERAKDRNDNRPTLDDVLQQAYCDAESYKLSDELQGHLYELLVSSCRSATRAKLGRKLEHPLSLWSVKGLARQIEIDPVTLKVQLYAAQHYPGTVTEVREWILTM